MVIIQTKDLKQSQKKYFDMVDEGLEVIVFRGKGRSYRIVKVTESKEKIFTIPQNEFSFEDIQKLSEKTPAELNDWIKEFSSIPKQYRCNPFEINPSGDIYFADKRNVSIINKKKEE